MASGRPDEREQLRAKVADRIAEDIERELLRIDSGRTDREDYLEAAVELTEDLEAFLAAVERRPR